MNRRQVLQTAAGTALSYQRILGANDRIAVALVGCGGRGRYVAGLMRKAPHTVFAAVADAYLPNAAHAKEMLGAERQVQDFRRLLDDQTIDAVQIATPDHWHASVAVLACAAGKHAYVEKPLAHNIYEGRAIVEAARRYKRIVQAGTQHRSSPHFAECREIVASGALGEVRFVRVWNYANLYPDYLTGNPPDSPPPEGLDWDLYLGPAPAAPFNKARFLATFRFFFDYAGGYITDFGTHRFDTVHQIMNVDRPLSVSATGGRYALRSAGDVPDVQQVTYEYPGFTMSYEGILLNSHGVGGRSPGMKYYNARGADDRPNGMAFYGTNGALYADRVGYEIYPEPTEPRGAPASYRMQRKQSNVTDATGLHAVNFIENLRNGRKPFADAESGHRATTIGLLGNIALKTGVKLRWDGEHEQFTGAPAEATALLRRTPRKPYDLIA